MEPNLFPDQRKVFLEQAQPIPGTDGATVGDYWQWASSDILSNCNRAVFAEFIVGAKLGVVADKPRIEWDSSDLRYRDYRIEVKASAYLQSWYQTRLSKISYSIAKARFFDGKKFVGKLDRCSDLYVFCLYPETNKNNVATVTDPSAWTFYVVSTETLNAIFKKSDEQREAMGKKSLPLTLATVEGLCKTTFEGVCEGGQCTFAELKDTVDKVLSGVKNKWEPPAIDLQVSDTVESDPLKEMLVSSSTLIP